MATADPDVSGRLFLAVGRLSRSLRRIGAPGQGHGSLSALSTLVSHGQLRLGDLAVKEAVSAATMSRIVATLVDAGYVRRAPDPADRRAWLVAATEEGERVLSGLRSTRVRELSRRMANLTPQARDSIVNALPALEDLLTDDE
jgi:DNA-binding MarR family transcriptional regulator